MPKVIQVRDVPDDVHRGLADEARRAGMSLNQYLLVQYRRMARRADNRRVLESLADLEGPRPTREQVLDQLDRDRRHGG